MMTQRRFKIPASGYTITKGNLTMRRSLVSLLEEYSRATGKARASEDEVLRWYRERGYTVKKGK